MAVSQLGLFLDCPACLDTKSMQKCCQASENEESVKKALKGHQRSIFFSLQKKKTKDSFHSKDFGLENPQSSVPKKRRQKCRYWAKGRGNQQTG